MEKMMYKVLVMIMVLLAMGVANAAENIPASELPAAVSAAVKVICQEGTIHKVEMEKVQGVVEYEVELMVGNKSCDLKIAADGTVIEIEKQMGLKELPKRVQKTIALFISADVEKAEQVQENDTTSYEVVLKFDEQKFELELSKDGLIQEIELKGHHDEEADD
jgi:uncharacterized membrane protein YkoI